MTETGLKLNARRQVAASVQMKMDLRDERFRPLGDLNAAMRDLDMDAREIDALLDSQLLIGFNIAVDPQGRRELRILTRSIAHYRETYGTRRIELGENPWPEIFKLILPHGKSIVTGLEIQRGLNCDRGHVENLALAKILAVKMESKPGPNGTPIFTRASYETFLKGRML